jgi:hypothetical protein
LKKIKFERITEAKGKEDEYVANIVRYNSKRAIEMEFELSQKTNNPLRGCPCL